LLRDDRRRSVFTAGVAGFTVTSPWCALAQLEPELNRGTAGVARGLRAVRSVGPRLRRIPDMDASDHGVTN